MAWELHKAARDGRDVAAWSSFLTAYERGGCTLDKALRLVLDKDVPTVERASAEIWSRGDLPADRWFRDAWRRSANGGPIWTDVERARPVQLRHIGRALSRANVQWFTRRDEPVAIDWRSARAAVARAGDEAELRTVWPQELEAA